MCVVETAAPAVIRAPLKGASLQYFGFLASRYFALGVTTGVCSVGTWGGHMATSVTVYQNFGFLVSLYSSIFQISSVAVYVPQSVTGLGT